MAYVIYDRASTDKVGRASYKTHAAAKAALTRMSKKWFSEWYVPRYPTVDRGDDPIYIYGIAELDHWIDNIQTVWKTTVTRTNLMTGQEYEEPVGTPLCCSPASETYWST